MKILPVSLGILLPCALTPLAAQAFDSTTLFAQPAASASVSLAFGKETVTASGITSRGRAILFSVAHEKGPWSVRVVRRTELLEDADGDAAVELALERAVPRRSLWVAVDLATGVHAAAAPGDYPVREVEIPPGLLLAGGGVLPERLRDRRRTVELLVVRPGSGAWRITSGDGGAEDEDGEANGEVVSALDRLQPLGESPGPPDKLQPGDLLVMIDSDRLEFYAARLIALRP